MKTSAKTKNQLDQLMSSATDSKSHIARKKTNTDRIFASLPFLIQQHHHYRQFGQATSSRTARRGASQSRRLPAIAQTPFIGLDRSTAEKDKHLKIKMTPSNYISRLSGLRQELFPDAIKCPKSFGILCFLFFSHRVIHTLDLERSCAHGSM